MPVPRLPVRLKEAKRAAAFVRDGFEDRRPRAGAFAFGRGNGYHPRPVSGNEEDARLRELGGGRILPLLWKFAWPALVTMTLNTLYNVIDRVYIGHGCGSDAIAGLTLTFPVMMVMGAFGPLIGVGSGTIISISLGEKDMARAERALGQCVALKLLLGERVVC